MTYSVTAPSFEGPLGLLLELAEKGKVELSEISVSDITARYMERVQRLKHLEPEELSDFLRLGSRLLYIKSLSLLPSNSDDEQRSELGRLQLELDEYRRYQQVARQLTAHLGRPAWHRPAVEKLEARDLPLPDIKLDALREAFNRAVRRAAPIRLEGSIENLTSQHDMEESLKLRLKNGSFALETALESAKDRFEVIVLFLALLEILKAGLATVVQAGQFGDIIIEARHA